MRWIQFEINSTDYVYFHRRSAGGKTGNYKSHMNALITRNSISCDFVEAWSKY